MKKHLNTLYVRTQGAWISKDGETVAVSVQGDVKLRVPIHMLEGIVCFGNVLVSPFLLGHCAETGVTVSFLTEHGRFLSRVVGPVSGNVILRRTQYRWADDEERAAELARSFVLGKVLNSRVVLQRAARDHSELSDILEPAIGHLGRAALRVQKSESVDNIRGIEGDAARIYFGVFGHLITRSDTGLVFSGRSRRPPRDEVNALLSFVYTLLLHDVRSALEAVGLDPQVGYLHRDRAGRPSLALDMLEEFRAPLADRLVLSLINRLQVRQNGFERRETGGVWMTDDTRKTVLVAYQERKRAELKHPFLNETCTYGALPHIQASLLARYIRGDLDAYPPYLAK